MMLLPRGLSPLRWRWIRFTTRCHELRFLYWPPCHPIAIREIQAFDREGWDIGRLVWVVCDGCRVGMINKISINPEHQSKGLGRQLIRRALADGPDYRWQTTGQSPQARRFFPAMERETGVAFPVFGNNCKHFTASAVIGRYVPKPHPRPVLDRAMTRSC